MTPREIVNESFDYSTQNILDQNTIRRPWHDYGRANRYEDAYALTFIYLYVYLSLSLSLFLSLSILEANFFLTIKLFHLFLFLISVRRRRFRSRRITLRTASSTTWTRQPAAVCAGKTTR